MRDCDVLVEMLKQQKHEHKYYGAICAAPAVVLAHHKLLVRGSAATSYPGFEKDMTDVAYAQDSVVVADKCVTSRGPGTAMAMGVKLVELLCGKEQATKVARGLLF